MPPPEQHPLATRSPRDGTAEAPWRHRGLSCALLAPRDGSSVPKLLVVVVLLPGVAAGWDLVVFVLLRSSQACWSRVVMGFPMLALHP